MHCTNTFETVGADMYHSDMNALDFDAGGGFDASGGFDDVYADDFDYNMDCGDFIF